MKKRNGCALLLAVLLCLSPFALAEEVFTINVDTLDMDSLNSDDYVARYLSANTQAVRVTKFLSGAGDAPLPVRLTLMQMDSHTLILDKDYGAQSGVFDSGVLYLPYVDNRTIPYLVTLYVGDMVYAMPFMHLQPRLSGNGACLRGVRLRELDASLPGDWMMGAVIDLAELAARGSMTLDLCASNRYLLGTAAVALQGDSLCVTPSYDSTARVQVEHESLYVVTDQMPLSAIYGPAYTPGQWVDVSGAQTALLYLNLQLSYDPAGLPTYDYDSSAAQRQLSLWQNSRSAGAESNLEPSDAAWPDNGWVEDSGWIDNGGWTDNGGWVDGWVDEPEWNAGWDDGWSNDQGWSDGEGWELPVG